MAGDWIKVEIGTASKTEVLRASEMLGISRRECMGLLCDYWSWLDANARTEVVPNLSRSSLDSVLHCPGFAACLESVGWAEWDESGWIMTVINYEHHNGSSAKTRASEQRKKREQRRDKTGSRGREELDSKEREKITAPTEEHIQIANTLKLNVADQWARYRDQQQNAKHKHSNLVAGFRNWLRRAPDFKPAPLRAYPSNQDARATIAAGHFKGHTDEHPTDITGQSERVA